MWTKKTNNSVIHLHIITLHKLNLYHSLWQFSRRQPDYMYIFSYFPQKIGFDISCKLSPLETECSALNILQNLRWFIYMYHNPDSITGFVDFCYPIRFADFSNFSKFTFLLSFPHLSHSLSSAKIEYYRTPDVLSFCMLRKISADNIFK